MSNDERKTQNPTYDDTLKRISDLELDKHSREDDAGVRYRLFRRFQQTTPHLAPSVQADAFAEIWDSGRLAGYLQSQRGAHEKLEKSFVGRMVNKMIERDCQGCEECKPSKPAKSDSGSGWLN